MKIDITPNELKMLIKCYEHKQFSLDKNDSRLLQLKDLYENLVNGAKWFDNLSSTNGLLVFCTYYEGMTFGDARELLDEIESHKES